MDALDNLDPVQVFTGTTWETGMLISILSDNEIDARLLGEGLEAVAPWLAEPGGGGAIKVVVAAKDYEKAMDVVREFRKTLQ